MGSGSEGLADRFSDRHGYRGTVAEIAVYEDAPENLRHAIPLIAQEFGMSPSVMRRIICRVLLVPPDQNNWSEYPNIWQEVVGLVADCPWYKVYDIAEAIHQVLAQGFSRAGMAEHVRAALPPFSDICHWPNRNGLML